MKNRILTLILTASVTCLAFAQAEHRHRADAPVPAKIVKGLQTITIVVANGRYEPSTISVKKGIPVAITFRGGTKIGCGATIEFPTLKQKRKVKEGQSVTFKFKPLKKGEIPFACPMKMYEGRVVVR